jgi:hypothetical protein
MNTNQNKTISRNFIYKQLRLKNTIEEINDKRGNSICLNLTKRILLNKPYKNPEYEKERMRKIEKIMAEMQSNLKESEENDN